jgi:transglutaminase-like putative cysteine protease
MQANLGSDVANGPIPIDYLYVTKYEYSDLVLENDNYLQITPFSEPHQMLKGYQLASRPEGSRVEFQDRFGNMVNRVRIVAPHREMVIATVGQVDLTPWAGPVQDGYVDELDINEEMEEFLDLSPLVNPYSFVELAGSITGASTRILDIAMNIVLWVYEKIEYVPGVTSTATTADDVLALGKGVCQDKTHIALALLRASQVPCRYVSGFLTRQYGDTHAWIEFAHPSLGWLPADPTKGRIVDLGTDYLKIAVGRDYTDVSPVKGSFVSGGSGRLALIHAQVEFGNHDISIGDALAITGVSPDEE